MKQLHYIVCNKLIFPTKPLNAPLVVGAAVCKHASNNNAAQMEGTSAQCLVELSTVQVDEGANEQAL
jgi:hypothetical protein